MNTSKTLLAILVEYLPNNGGWPHATTSIGQDWDRELMFYGRRCVRTGIILDDLAIDHRKRFDTGVKITREQYEAALAASKEPLTGTGVDGWIDWPGGECPVEPERLVDIKLRDGSIFCGMDADGWRWSDIGHNADIIAYRLHQPQDVTKVEINAPDCAINGAGELPKKAEQVRDDAWNAYAGITEVDNEADLNDCIGQAPAPVYSGYGVPPVGAAIEWREGRRWYPGTVTAIGEQLIIIKDQHGEEGYYSLEHTDFRRANFEVDELAAVIDASDEGGELIPSHQKAIAKHLIDAGYRKQ